MLQVLKPVPANESSHLNGRARLRHPQCACPSVHSPRRALLAGRRLYTQRQSRLQVRRKEWMSSRGHPRCLRLCPTSSVRQCLNQQQLRQVHSRSPRSCASRSVFLQASRCVACTQCRQLPNQVRRRPKTPSVRCFRRHRFLHSTNGGAWPFRAMKYR